MDLRLLAEAAEAEGIDFRVLYLRRSARDFIVANSVHRLFQESLKDSESRTHEGRLMDYMQIMFTEIAVVHSLLAEIDPKFVVCHDYARLGEVQQASEIGEVLAPSAELAHLLASSFVEAVVGHDVSNVVEPLSYPFEESLVFRLQRKLDTFEPVYCGHR
ncbi:unnamed protein product [Hapterophycus canaliculatus]